MSLSVLIKGLPVAKKGLDQANEAGITRSAFYRSVQEKVNLTNGIIKRLSVLTVRLLANLPCIETPHDANLIVQQDHQGVVALEEMGEELEELWLEYYGVESGDINGRMQALLAKLSKLAIDLEKYLVSAEGIAYKNIGHVSCLFQSKNLKFGRKIQELDAEMDRLKMDVEERLVAFSGGITGGAKSIKPY
ncbi:hypothetical protein BJ508DRAFT_329433 [Ascobolus immersus RN42]|uniref:Uncharacterized protein n=1 Tax=Ascobolus immersus RN42 TaxID=1160509 RepID=A0A3N4HXA1_ASCIM|nr:hypothetical protein BJ508DRAFT_329433 [Ascobolus immersus RN42]